MAECIVNSVDEIDSVIRDGIRVKYADIHLSYHNEYIRHTRMVNKKKKIMRFRYTTDKEYLIAIKEAVLYRDNMYYESNNDSGIKNIQLSLTSNGVIRLRGSIKYKDTVYKKLYLIHNVNEYEERLISMMDFMEDLLGIKHHEEYNYFKGEAFIKQHLSKPSLNVYLINVNGGLRVINGYDEDDVKVLLGDERVSGMVRVGVCDNDERGERVLNIGV